VRFECRSAVELLAAGGTRERRGAVDVGVGGVDVMRQVVGVSEDQSADGAHRLAHRRPRRVVGTGVAAQGRPCPVPPGADGTGVRWLDTGNWVRRPAVRLQSVAAVRLVAALLTDEPVASVDDRHVHVQLGGHEEGLVAELAPMRSNAVVAQHVQAQLPAAVLPLAALAAQQRL